MYAISVVATDLEAVWTAVFRLSIVGWFVILGLSVINYVLRFLRWQGYLAKLGHHIPVGWHLAYYLSGFAFTTTPGKAGETVRSLYLKRHQVPYSSSLACFFVERFMDIVAIVLLALAAAFAFEAVRWPVFLLGSLVVLLLPLIHSQMLQNFLNKRSTGNAASRFSIMVDHLQNLLQSSSTLLRTGSLYSGLAIGLLAWGAEGYGFYLILDYLGIHTSFILAVGIYALSILVGAVSFIPGGLGSTEAAMFLMLSYIGADAPTAIAATLICRVATLWFAVIIGLFTVGGLAIRRSNVMSQETF